MTDDKAETRPLHPAFKLIGEHPADRVMNAQALTFDGHLHGDPPPTRNQVAAVFHALADLTHQHHMLGTDVADLGRYADVDPPNQAHGLGRYFHALGDWLTGFGGTSTEAYVNGRRQRRI